MNWPGASAELVETYLGSPIESAVQAVRGVKRIGSESGEGYVQLDIRARTERQRPAGSARDSRAAGIASQLSFRREPPGLR